MTVETSTMKAGRGAAGLTCRCGVYRKGPGYSKHVVDDGMCTAHPEKPPQRYAAGAEPKCCGNPDYRQAVRGGSSGHECAGCLHFIDYEMKGHGVKGEAV